MYINEEYTAGIIPLRPSGTNSTMFTECCEVAICDNEQLCPRCKRKVIGWDANSSHERGQIRWGNATRNWKR
jgi:hypothetical protein